MEEPSRLAELTETNVASSISGFDTQVNLGRDSRSGDIPNVLADVL